MKRQLSKLSASDRKLKRDRATTTNNNSSSRKFNFSFRSLNGSRRIISTEGNSNSSSSNDDDDNKNNSFIIALQQQKVKQQQQFELQQQSLDFYYDESNSSHHKNSTYHPTHIYSTSDIHVPPQPHLINNNDNRLSLISEHGTSSIYTDGNSKSSCPSSCGSSYNNGTNYNDESEFSYDFYDTIGGTSSNKINNITNVSINDTNYNYNSKKQNGPIRKKKSMQKNQYCRTSSFIKKIKTNFYNYHTDDTHEDSTKKTNSNNDQQQQSDQKHRIPFDVNAIKNSSNETPTLPKLLVLSSSTLVNGEYPMLRRTSFEDGLFTDDDENNNTNTRHRSNNALVLDDDDITDDIDIDGDIDGDIDSDIDIVKMLEMDANNDIDDNAKHGSRMISLDDIDTDINLNNNNNNNDSNLFVLAEYEHVGENHIRKQSNNDSKKDITIVSSKDTMETVTRNFTIDDSHRDNKILGDCGNSEKNNDSSNNDDVKNKDCGSPKTVLLSFSSSLSKLSMNGPISSQSIVSPNNCVSDDTTKNDNSLYDDENNKYADSIDGSIHPSNTETNESSFSTCVPTTTTSTNTKLESSVVTFKKPDSIQKPPNITTSSHLKSGSASFPSPSSSSSQHQKQKGSISRWWSNSSYPIKCTICAMMLVLIAVIIIIPLYFSTIRNHDNKTINGNDSHIESTSSSNNNDLRPTMTPTIGDVGSISLRGTFRPSITHSPTITTNTSRSLIPTMATATTTSPSSSPSYLCTDGTEAFIVDNIILSCQSLQSNPSLLKSSCRTGSAVRDICPVTCDICPS